MKQKSQVHAKRAEVESKWKVSSETLVDPKELLWKDLPPIEKAIRVLSIITKLFGICFVIFGFICTLALLADAFKLIGGRGVGRTIQSSRFIQNPISASIIGMVITLLIQSSSTLSSVLVGMIAGGLLTVHQAIPIMLGSEMGASLINALVSLTQVGNRDQFRRAFAAVTVNDVFNFLSYFILMPIEVGTGVIEKISGAIVQPLSGVKASEIKTLNFLTDPVLNYIIRINEDAIDKAALADENSTLLNSEATFIYRCVDLRTSEYFTFSLISCLIGIVKLMQALLGGQIGILVRKLMDKDLPWPFTCFTNYVVMVVGCVIVMIIQSSGVFRAVLTPLVGIGVVTLERLYPLLLGANVGTTFTGVLAAFSADPAKIKETLQMALAQTVYNLIGVILFYPIPFMRRIPINIAKKLANKTSKVSIYGLRMHK
uniref:Uncharacterized protein n=1 Tax=Acrobeloides nanus TaxID=290746 RepID=A0A914E840_9BILA